MHLQSSIFHCYVSLPECNTYAAECVEKCSFISIPHDKKLQELTDSLSKVILTKQQTQKKTQHNNIPTSKPKANTTTHSKRPFRLSKSRTKQSKKASLPKEWKKWKLSFLGWVTEINIRGPFSSMILHPLVIMTAAHGDSFVRWDFRIPPTPGTSKLQSLKFLLVGGFSFNTFYRDSWFQKSLVPFPVGPVT